MKAIARQMLLNPIALRKAKIAYNFGLSECSKVKASTNSQYPDESYFITKEITVYDITLYEC